MSDSPDQDYTTKSRKSRVIRLPIEQNEYSKIVNSSHAFRCWLDGNHAQYPELFPDRFSSGYLMKDSLVSEKIGLVLRRITVAGIAYSVRPSFVLPYLRKSVDIDVASNALFLRKFSVPFWALAYVFGEYPMYWYRLEASLGRFSVAGTTVKSPELLPSDIAADEKHTKGGTCKTPQTSGFIVNVTIFLETYK